MNSYFPRRVSYGEMVACENPDCRIEWFHFKCVGLKKAVRTSLYILSMRFGSRMMSNFRGLITIYIVVCIHYLIQICCSQLIHGFVHNAHHRIETLTWIKVKIRLLMMISSSGHNLK